jgi:hypothetical protein
VVEKILGKGNTEAAIPNAVANFLYGSSGAISAVLGGIVGHLLVPGLHGMASSKIGNGRSQEREMRGLPIRCRWLPSN